MSLLAQVGSTLRAEGAAAVVSKGYRVLGMRVLGDNFYHRPIVRAILRRAAAYPTFVDAGAHTGAVSQAVASAFLRCIAVEPVPEHATVLRERFSHSATANCSVVQKALGPQAGVASLNMSSSNSGDNTLIPRADLAHSIPVEVTTLDRILADCEADGAVLLKLDVQGYEHDALLGAPRTLTGPCAIVSELWPWGLREAGRSAYEYPELLMSYGLHPHTLRGQAMQAGRLRRLCELGEKDPNVVTDIFFERLS